MSPIKNGIAMLAEWLHGIMLYFLWYNISSVARISTSEDFANWAEWVGRLVSVFSVIYILQYALFNMAGSTSPIPQFSFIIIFFGRGNLGILDLTLDPKAPKPSRTQWVLAEALLFDFSSAAISWLFRSSFLQRLY